VIFNAENTDNRRHTYFGDRFVLALACEIAFGEASGRYRDQ